MKDLQFLVSLYTKGTAIGRCCSHFVISYQQFILINFLWFSASLLVVGNNNANGKKAGVQEDSVKTYSASIGDWVWLDLNKDGIQDDYEEGLNDFVVILYNIENHQVVSTKTKNHPETGMAGYYHFNQLAEGSYFIVFEIPTGYEASPKDVGNNKNDCLDSDADPISGATDTIYLKTGEIAKSWSIGLCLPALADTDYLH